MVAVHRGRSTTENLRFWWFLLRKNSLTVVGMAIVAMIIVVAILAPVIAPYDPTQVNVKDKLQPPSRGHLMGTDHVGMDVFSRVVHGARVDLTIAGSAVLLAILIGVPMGAVAGYSRGWFDDVIMRAADAVQAFPSLILAMALVAAIGANKGNMIAVVAFVNFPNYLRLVRAQMLSARESQYAEAARSVGNRPIGVVFRHLLPNCLGPVYVQSSLNLGWAILLVASLSFIGLGVRIPTPEWGLMISQGADYLVLGDWWVSFFPGLAIMLAVLGFNLMGDGIQDIFDPKRR